MSALEETLVRFQHHGGTNTSEILKAIEQDNPESVRRINDTVLGIGAGGDEDEPEHPICERCGDFTDELFPVEDRDDSTGYRDELMVCRACKDSFGRRRA